MPSFTSSLTVSCPHSECVAVVCVSQSAAESSEVLICENCFVESHSPWIQSEVVRKGNLLEQECELCGNESSRWRSEYDGGICDACAFGEYEQEKGFFESMKTMNRTEYDIEIPNEIIPGLFLGSMNSSFEVMILQQFQIHNVIVCGPFLPEFLQNSHLERQYPIRYLRIPVADSIDEELIRYLPIVCRFIDECLVQRQEGILVHCQAGISRSASVIIAWLMYQQHIDYSQAFTIVQSQRNFIHPNERFMKDLQTIWNGMIETNNQSSTITI
jgi:hypothetical protein